MAAIDHELVGIPATRCEIGIAEEDLETWVAAHAEAAAAQIFASWDHDREDEPFARLGVPVRALGPSEPDVIRRVLRTWLPRRVVSVAAFEVDRTRVMNRQYDVFVRETGRAPPPSWPDGRIPAGRERWPVRNVSHKDAFSYAAWAGLEMIREDEWLIAAGAADGRRHPWGDAPSPLLEALLLAREASMFDADAHPELASPYGVLGLVSDSFEWCYDAFGPLPGGDPAAFAAVFTSVDPSFRALRGGHTYAQQWSVHARVGNAPSANDRPYGFRCVRRADTVDLRQPDRIPEVRTAPAETPALGPAERDRWIDLLRRDVQAFNAARNALPDRPRIDLRGADLRGLDLRRAHIGRCDLSGADLRGARIQPITVKMCRLEGTLVEGIAADRPETLEHVLLLALLWRDAAAFNARRPEVWMVLDVDLSGCRIGAADLTRAHFHGSRLAGADFSRATLRNTDFFQCDLRGARFSGNELDHCNLEMAVLDDAWLVGATLRLASFTDASMERARLQHALLERCSLIGTRARAASFACAELRRTRFHAADLRLASFRGAVFDDVRVEVGRADGADLRDVHGAPVLDRVAGSPPIVAAGRARGEPLEAQVSAALARLRTSGLERLAVGHPDVDELVLRIGDAPPSIDPQRGPARELDVTIRAPGGESSRIVAFGPDEQIDALLRDGRRAAVLVLESIETSLESLRAER